MATGIGTVPMYIKSRLDMLDIQVNPCRVPTSTARLGDMENPAPGRRDTRRFIRTRTNNWNKRNCWLATVNVNRELSTTSNFISLFQLGFFLNQILQARNAILSKTTVRKDSRSHHHIADSAAFYEYFKFFAQMEAAIPSDILWWLGQRESNLQHKYKQLEHAPEPSGGPAVQHNHDRYVKFIVHTQSLQGIK